MTTIAIVGSRTFTDQELVARALQRLANNVHHAEFVSGGARGADEFGAEAARELGLNVTVHLPDWNRYGKSAGFRRNELIVADADILVAFFSPGPRSKGTEHSVNLAVRKGIPVHLYHEGKWLSWPSGERFPHYDDQA